VSPITSVSAGNENASGHGKWPQALEHLSEALKILDESDAPPEIGADLDLVIHRLRSAMGGGGQVDS
jgi:hypothetical protein